MISYYILIGLHGTLFLACLVAVVAATRITSSEYKHYMILTQIGCAITVISKLFAICSNDIDSYLLAGKYEYLGKTFVVALLAAFVIHYYRVTFLEKIIPLVYAIALFFFLAVCTDDVHHLYYKSISPIRTGGLGGEYQAVAGPLHTIYMSYLLAVMVLFFAICCAHYYKEGVNHKEVNVQITLAVGGVLPFVGAACYISGLTEIDFTSFFIGIAGIVVSSSIRRYGLFDTVEVAKETVIDNMEVAMIVFDKYRNFLYANAMAATIYPDIDFTAKEVSGYELEAIFATPGRVIQRNGRNFELRTMELKENGEIKGYIAYFIDVTEQEERAAAMEELKVEAERIATAKSEFIASMSHEFRAPSYLILGIAEAALDTKLASETRSAFEGIKDASRELLSISNNIMNLQDIESGAMSTVKVPYNVRNLVEESVAIMEHRAKSKGLELKYAVSDSVPQRVVGDDIRIKQVLLTIVANAIENTSKGYVNVSVLAHSMPDNKIGLEMVVKDTGKGLKNEDIARWLNEHGANHRFSGGDVDSDDMSLIVANQIITVMGGSMNVESVFGEGSTFYFEVPQELCKNESEAHPIDNTEAVNKQESALMYEEKRVLVVDDTKANRVVAKAMLGQSGIVPDMAESGPEAISMCQDKEYDLILMDRMMPGMDGVETLGRIREISAWYKNAPAVAVTGDVSAESVAEFKQAGFVSYIEKPLTTAALKNILDKYLGD